MSVYARSVRHTFATCCRECFTGPCPDYAADDDGWPTVRTAQDGGPCSCCQEHPRPDDPSEDW